jgi:TetR/AcrR family transcriptional regulator, regulator of cefoperazone and chloramphenicol sensitivity
LSTPLEKARKHPDSMKARILKSARILFGEYGYHGVTTRMIAGVVGIDISTLHYHWGDKENLYEAVVTDIHEEVIGKLIEIERIVHGRSIRYRLEVAIDVMCDYLLAKPEVPKLIIVASFGKTRPDGIQDDRLTEHIPKVAVAMGLASKKKDLSPRDSLMVLVISNALHAFTSGEETFRRLLKVDPDEYSRLVKETLKYILVPAFARNELEKKE